VCNARLAERVGGVFLGVSATGNRKCSTRAKAKGPGGESGSRVGCWDAACAVLGYSCTVLHC
jgi:hypothetical protein